jgi:hypothetical protein
MRAELAVKEQGKQWHCSLSNKKKKRWILKGVILTLTLTLIIALIRYYFLWYSLQGVV